MQVQMDKNPELPLTPLPPTLPSSFTQLPAVVPEIHLSNVISAEKEVSQTCSQMWSYITESSEQCKLVSFYQQVYPVLQQGPMCGIVALCMANQILNSQDSISVDKVLFQAQHKGFTKQGEMFSARNMAVLAEDVLKCNADVWENGLSDTVAVLHHLAEGWPILVPYDADGNHEPCCKNGHSAHWGILTGFCFTNHTNQIDISSFKMDDNIPKLYHARKGQILVDNLQTLSTSERIFVYGHQGKSKYLGVWQYKRLCESNRNLNKVAPKHQVEGQFNLPVGGIEEGLCNKIVVLTPESREL
ncbi:UPF0692 protein C19orf54 homolog [Limulus polyphemus]|uniref:Actin maturation protease n=1 Tax=Limulus polyphemus TaxID=6850 RepID=A0ABM1BMP3_LIMPO|nr:UPF0692 protein C19orf54 homolog [Limulus polyphemus]